MHSKMAFLWWFCNEEMFFNKVLRSAFLHHKFDCTAPFSPRCIKFYDLLCIWESYILFMHIIAIWVQLLCWAMMLQAVKSNFESHENCKHISFRWLGMADSNASQQKKTLKPIEILNYVSSQRTNEIRRKTPQLSFSSV